MEMITYIFWILLGVVFYAYVGYGIILFVLIKMKRFLKKEDRKDTNVDLPEVTLLIAAYNEKDFVTKKVANTRSLNYPKEKLQQVWVTDGSDDGTPNMLKKYNNVTVLHKPERNGKIAAMNRAIKFVKTPIVIFSDANTELGENSILEIARLFSNPKVGCVSGEKRIVNSSKESAAAAGEGMYWKYESMLKKWDAELYSVVGAAGELFAIRTELYQEVEPDTLLDDFIISLRVAMKGYTIQYNPEAYAIERASADVKEELKRKIRIAAGGIQSVVRLRPLLNIFKYGMLSFQYVSHRVLRWTVAPLALLLIFILNIYLMLGNTFYTNLFILQVFFYGISLIGWAMKSKKLKGKLLFIPYYFFIMNYAVYMGFFRYINKTQSVNWERAKRG